MSIFDPLSVSAGGSYYSHKGQILQKKATNPSPGAFHESDVQTAKQILTAYGYIFYPLNTPFFIPTSYSITYHCLNKISSSYIQEVRLTYLDNQTVRNGFLQFFQQDVPSNFHFVSGSFLIGLTSYVVRNRYSSLLNPNNFPINITTHYFDQSSGSTNISVPMPVSSNVQYITLALYKQGDNLSLDAITPVNAYNYNLSNPTSSVSGTLLAYTYELNDSNLPTLLETGRLTTDEENYLFLYTTISSDIHLDVSTITYSGYRTVILNGVLEIHGNELAHFQ